MDTSSLIVAVMPIVTLIALFTGIALPFIAASRPGAATRGGAGRRRCAEAGRRRRAEGPAAPTRRW